MPVVTQSYHGGTLILLSPRLQALEFTKGSRHKAQALGKGQADKSVRIKCGKIPLLPSGGCRPA